MARAKKVAGYLLLLAALLVVVSVLRISPSLQVYYNNIESSWEFQPPALNDDANDDDVNDGDQALVSVRAKEPPVSLTSDQLRQQRLALEKYRKNRQQMILHRAHLRPRPQQQQQLLHANDMPKMPPSSGGAGFPQRKRPEKQKVIYFLHIHKAAGTTMCKQAQRNMLVTAASKNCNVQTDQQCCGYKDTIEAQIQYGQQTSFDFVACEREMYDSMAPDYYHYVVILRKSRLRYYSHWNHMHRESRGLGGGSFGKWWSAQPDNWNTRILCGPTCLHNSKFQITRDLFQYTLQRLALFEDILFVEDMSNSYSKFAKKHGWRHYVTSDPNKNATELSAHNVRSDPNKNATELSAQGWDPLMSALDDALYEFAKRKDAGMEPLDAFSTGTQAALDNYFETGMERGCTNKCCAGSCSKYR
jgi:hypothetical protein